ncbi:MAG: radical SAM protein [Acidobacteriota bacterium]
MNIENIEKLRRKPRRAYKQPINELHFYFKKLWKESKPIAKLFRTDSHGYLYDTGTNKILKCDDIEYSLLTKLISMDIEEAINKTLSEYTKEQFIEAANKIRSAIEKENILQTKKATQFGLSAHFHNIEELINTSLGMVQLEITEQCNLRCNYCIYNPFVSDKRNHGNRNMNPSVAKAAIDYLTTHSSGKEGVAVTFYGGEPLLRFPFIKSCVNYAHHTLNKKRHRFSLTTNSTLLTAEMADFFYHENFSVVVSIDGPEEIHDDYRKDFRGRGSFKHTILGLKNLIDVFGEGSKERIFLSMVYTPPYSERKLNRISKLWVEIPWLPKDIPVLITYPHSESIPTEKYPNNSILEDKTMLEWAIERYMDYYTGKSELNPIANSIIEEKLARLIQRPIYPKPIDKYYLNGCCIPGVRKIFVSTEGDFHLCERVPSTAPKIGNVYSGIDIETIENIYIDEYSTKSLPSCSTCWAIQLCPECYVNAFNNGKFDINKKIKNCIIAQYLTEKYLRFFCKLLDLNPKGLNYLSKWRIE